MSQNISSKRIAECIAIALFLSLPLLAVSAFAYDFAGTAKLVSGTNSMTVNVTQPGTYGLQAQVEVLLDKPLANLAYFQGKDLQFEILGHDILGRPVCEVYLDGTNIRDVSYCRLYPVDCSYYQNSPAYYGWYGWSGEYVYLPCYYGQCRFSYPYQWLPFF
jgi:hypothetical protein